MDGILNNFDHDAWVLFTVLFCGSIFEKNLSKVECEVIMSFGWRAYFFLQKRRTKIIVVQCCRCRRRPNRMLHAGSRRQRGNLLKLKWYIIRRNTMLAHHWRQLLRSWNENCKACSVCRIKIKSLCLRGYCGMNKL